jgi:hypothetical protein
LPCSLFIGRARLAVKQHKPSGRFAECFGREFTISIAIIVTSHWSMTPTRAT